MGDAAASIDLRRSSNRRLVVLLRERLIEETPWAGNSWLSSTPPPCREVANTMQESTRPKRLLTMGSPLLHGEFSSLRPPRPSTVARLRVLDSRAGDVINTDLLDLVRRCQGGDPDAWRALLSPFQEVGRRTLRSFRLSAADLDDVLADALTALYAGGLAQFKGATVAELIG